jgi:nitrate reductase NapE component
MIELAVKVFLVWSIGAVAGYGFWLWGYASCKRDLTGGKT